MKYTPQNTCWKSPTKHTTNHPPTHLCIHTSRQKCYEIKIVACEKRHCSDGIGHFLLISWIYEIRAMDRPTKLNIYIVQRKEGNGRHTQRDREWDRTVFGKRRAQLKLDNDLKRAKQNWTMGTEHNRNIFNIDKSSFMKLVCVSILFIRTFILSTFHLQIESMDCVYTIWNENSLMAVR